MQTWNVLDTPEIMYMLLPKLPIGTRDKWPRRVLRVRRKQDHKKTKSRRVATFVSGSKETSVDLTVRSRCINCGENHQLDGCLKFMDMALKGRINFSLKKKYCFGCLQPVKPQHNTKTCNEGYESGGDAPKNSSKQFG